MLSLIALPYGIAQIQAVKAESAMKDIKSAIFLAEQNAFTKNNNKTYGIAFFNNNYVTYTGTSLAAADTQDTFRMTTEITIKNINFSGTELVFTAGSFRPVHAGSLDVTDEGGSYRIMVSSEGLITSIKL